MTQQQKVRDFLAKHPGCYSSELAKALGITVEVAAGCVSTLIRQGEARKEPGEPTLSGARRNRYWLVKKAPAPAPSHKPKREVKRTENVLSSPNGSLDALVEQLASGLVDQIVPLVKAKLAQQLPTLLPKAKPMPVIEYLTREEVPPAEPLPPAEPQETKSKRRKVLVVGLIPAQMGHIDREFGNTFDMEFLETGEYAKAKALAPHCDIVYLHVKHGSHSMQDTLRSAGANLRLVGGGMTELRTQLQGYWERVKKEGVSTITTPTTR